MGSCCSKNITLNRYTLEQYWEDSGFYFRSFFGKYAKDVCFLCEDKHSKDLETKHQYEVGNLKYRNFLISESCQIHPNRNYKYWCKPCQRPICIKCEKHWYHKKMDLMGTCVRTIIERNKDRIIRIRSEVLPYNRALLAQMKSDLERLNTKICNLQLEMNSKAKNLKKEIETRTVLRDMRGSNLYLDSKLQQRRYIINIHKYLQIFEQLEKRPVQFLFLLKKYRVTKIKNLPRKMKLSLTDEINIDDVARLFENIQFIETGKRKLGDGELLRVMSTIVLHKSFTVNDIRGGISHICIVSPDQIWVNDYNNLILTNTEEGSLSLLKDISSLYGIHTLTKDGDLTYIDKNLNVVVLSAKNKTKTPLIKMKEPWTPRCLFCSPLNGDILVGAIWYNKSEQRYTEANITRYNSEGQQLQIIQHSDDGEDLYSDPIYTTENRNGDIIVSDMYRRTIVVTDIEGRYRFSYKGSPSNPGFFAPGGICTDALSNILVCDDYTKTVHMTDKDGRFLSLLLTEQNGINRPGGLCYDDKTHLLWVGSWWDNKVSVYRYIKSKELIDSSD